MTITFENDNDIRVYALEKVICYARRTQQIFVVQCVWWLASVIGLEPSLASHIDKLHRRTTLEEPRHFRDSPPVQEVPIPGPDQTTKEFINPVTQDIPEVQDLEVQGSKGEQTREDKYDMILKE
jgi:hypothetical protein